MVGGARPAGLHLNRGGNILLFVRPRKKQDWRTMPYTFSGAADHPTASSLFLTRLGHNVDTVRTEQLTARAGPDVWSAPQAAQRFLITQDLDFSDVRRYRPGTHAGLLLVRLSRPGRNALFERISTAFQTERVDESTGCLVVATEQKIRIRRPEPPREG
jgi:hypothetical protein